MIKYFIFVLFSLGTIFCFGQKTKEITVKHKNPYYNETYNVLKSDKSLRHGEYKKTTGVGKTLIEGQYENGQKNGTWYFYNYQGNKIKEGNYKNNEAYGIWKVYNGQEKPKYSYDFSSNRISEYNYLPTEDSSIRIIINGDTSMVNADHPVLPKVETSIIEEVYSKVRYPAMAKDDAVSGTVIVGVVVNKDGSSSTPKIYKSVHPLLDKEALRVVENMDDKWIPATYRGSSVKSIYFLSIRFKLG